MYSFRIGLWRSAAAAGLLFVGAVHSFATPVNDGFASASVLSPGLPSTAAGSNIDATTEVGELLPYLTRRTVWWSWTPTVGGWVRVSTRGTNIDTVLSAFTGATLSGLTRQAFNDDVGGADTGSGRSELIFFASAGETYRLQVGGFAGWEGTFSLDLAKVSAPPQLTKLSFTPGAADVSSQPALMTFDLGVTHPAGLRFGRLSVFRPDGTREGEASLDSTTRLSGTAAAGTYRVAITIQQRVQPGNYTLWVDLNGIDSRRAVYGERTPFPVGVARTLPVINTGVIDAEPPQLALFSTAPASVDVTTTQQTVTLTAQIVDTISGVIDFSSSLEVRSPSGESIGGGDFSRRNRTKGDSFDGTYAIKFTIPAGALPGSYPLRIHLIDALGNRVAYGPDFEAGEIPFPVGLPDHFTVVNTGPVDTQAPILTAASVNPGTVNVAEFELLHLKLSVHDAQSGAVSAELAGAVFGLRPVNGGTTVEASMSLFRTSGTPTDGVWEGSTSLPDNLAAGNYLVVGIQLTDALDNTATYGPTALGLTAYPVGINPVVTIVSQPLDGPYLIWLKSYPTLQGRDAAPDADPDGDGLSNLMELALGTHPLIRSARGGADPHASNAPHVYRKSNRVYMDYDVVSTNLGTGPKAIQVFAEESTDLKTWSGAVRLILEEGYSAFISINSPQKWLRLRVTDPADYPAH